MMKLIIYVSLLFLGVLNFLQAQDIYRGGVNLITGTWEANGTIIETDTGQPFEGNEHLRFNYSFSEFWCGFGLNLDQWGVSDPVDFSGYTHLRFSYRGLENGQTLRLQLRSGDEFGNLREIGGLFSDYQEVEIPLILLQGSLDLTSITELHFSVNGSAPEGSGSLFLDAIYLVNSGGTEIGSQSWGLLQSMGKGFNLTNWLEAYWLIPFNAFPETDKFTRDHIAFLADAGMNTIRMPATFERVAGPAPDYALDLNHELFTLVDSVIQWAADYNLKLIIDNHHGFELTDDNFQTELERKKAIWNQLLVLYGHLDPGTTIFELYNEPTPAISNNNLAIFFEELVVELRNTTTQHTFIIGANGWNSGDALMSFSPLNDQRIIYTFHSYDPYLFTHQGMSWTSPPNFEPSVFPIGNEENEIRNLFRGVSAWSDIYDVPVFLGEFGCAVSADELSRCNYIQLLTHLSDSLNIPYAYWDVFQPTDGFGFVEGGILEAGQVISCFAIAMELNFGFLSTSFFDIRTDCKGEFVELWWRLDEINEEHYFELEYSSNGIDWSTSSIATTLKEMFTIQYTIPSALGPYYRIKEWLSDGSFIYSPMQYQKCKETMNLEIYPNPTTNNIYFQAETKHLESDIKILNMSGKIIFSFPIRTTGMHTIPIQHIQPGTYYVFMDQNGVRISDLNKLVVLDGDD